MRTKPRPVLEAVMSAGDGEALTTLEFTLQRVFFGGRGPPHTLKRELQQLPHTLKRELQHSPHTLKRELQQLPHTRKA